MINKNFGNLADNYLFASVAKKTAEYAKNHPDKKIIKLGIGDVTLPLCPAVVSAMGKAVAEMGIKETFHGYRSDEGYEFLRRAIADYYKGFGVEIGLDEIFVGEGAKNDIGNIVDIFSNDAEVFIPDPVYPVYVDTNIMDGRKIVYYNANAENGFLPLPDKTIKSGIIYICSPNNPTGAVYSREQLKKWVDRANETGAVILFDSAYEAFIKDPSLPHSIFEIEGARDCAVEFCSFSKTAGFTGIRCGYTVIPASLKREGVSLAKLWLRRQSTKFNGVSYVTQRGAEAVFTPEGRAQTGAAIGVYKSNARAMTAALDKIGIWYTGGENSPYVWLRCPKNMDSWSFFDLLLQKANVVGTPGAGFGKNGEGFFRLTAFGDPEMTREACDRLVTLLR